jgi:hypothetical protein
MTEQEVRDIIKGCGWSFLLRTRRGRKEYIYATRSIQGQRKEIYIGSLASLESMTVDKLKTILSCS